MKKEYNLFDEYFVCEDVLIEMEYLFVEIKFLFWVFIVEEVCVFLFELGNEGLVFNIFLMEMGENGIWNILIKEDLKGKFYIFNVKVNGKWLGDILGIMVKVVGVNGKWVVVFDFCFIDLEEWENDVCFFLKNYVDIMVYEMYYCDFFLDFVFGI